MHCRDLAERIQAREPNADTSEVARLCLLMTNIVEDIKALDDDQQLSDAHRDASLRLQAATDQHMAVTQELEELAKSDPSQFDREQIWVLLRAIKVQSQILQMYIGGEVIDV
jgi:hypothetical protein